MEDLYKGIETSHQEVKVEREKLTKKIDQLINEATKARDQIEQIDDDKKAVN